MVHNLLIRGNQNLKKYPFMGSTFQPMGSTSSAIDKYNCVIVKFLQFT